MNNIIKIYGKPAPHKNIFQYSRSIWEFAKCKYDTFVLSHTHINRLGVTKEKRQQQIVVSLTSYPGRIGIVDKCIKTLLKQTIKPDHVILVLADEQFEQKEKELPARLLELQQYGLEIIWSKDIRSYKKIIPIYNKWKDHIIITVDDDNYYKRTWLERLYKSYMKNPTYIHCNIAKRFEFDTKGNLFWTQSSRVYYKSPTILNSLVGCGGVLYPPNSLYEDVIKDSIFMEIAPTNDDLWLWAMSILKGTPTMVIDKPDIWSKIVEGTINSGLSYFNHGQGSPFINQLEAIINKYPRIVDLLKDEYAK